MSPFENRVAVVTGIPLPSRTCPRRSRRGAGPRRRRLWVDAWVETVPSDTENTAIALHLDVPEARAPQAILLAVPPDPTARWSFDALVDVLRETVGLAEIRAVVADLLPTYGHLLPAAPFAHNVGDVPGGETLATTFGG